MPTLKKPMNPENEIWIDNFWPSPDSSFWEEDSMLNLDEIDALLRPFKEENDETLENKINKTEYKSKEFYSVLDEINKKDYDWQKEP